LQTRVDSRCDSSDRHTQRVSAPVLVFPYLNEALSEPCSSGYDPLAPAALAEPCEAGNEIGRSGATCARGCAGPGCVGLRMQGKDAAIADGVRRSPADRR
jgi:hypothetical protein